MIDDKQLEKGILDEWIYLPLLSILLLFSFNIGLLIGWLWILISAI
jgi:hypothetical protein